MAGEAQPIPRSISIDIGEKFGRSAPLVAANAEPDDTLMTHLLHRRLGNAHCLLRAKVPYCIEDPVQRDAEVPLPPRTSPLHAGKNLVEITFPGKARAYREIYLCVLQLLLRQPLHPPVG